MTVPSLLCPVPDVSFESVQFKATPEDFIVEELPLYEPVGAGTHTYFWIEKAGLSTHDAARMLARALGKNPLDAGVAGLKDAQAITRQWISFEHLKTVSTLAHFAELFMDSARKQSAAPVASGAPESDPLLSGVPPAGPGLRVLRTAQHGNKLKMGHLRGNRFIIRLRAEKALVPVLHARAMEVLATLAQRGIPNFYGPQRFGWGGDNVALGRELVRGNEAGFAELWRQQCGNKRPPDRKLRNLLVNSFQSELFNQVLMKRMPDLGTLLAGDLACLHRNGAVFRVANAEEAAREQQRCASGELSPSGPIFGPKMVKAEGLPGEMEAAVLAASGVSAEDFGRREAERQPGARRSMRIMFLEESSAEIEADGVVLKFSLPSGAYATIVVSEILGKRVS